jgi:hypothetical protein
MGVVMWVGRGLNVTSSAASVERKVERDVERLDVTLNFGTFGLPYVRVAIPIAGNDLLEFKLVIHPYFTKTKPHSFSRADTVEYLEAVLRKEFEVEEDAECRVWHKFMTHTNGQVKLLDYHHLFICFI